MPDWYAQPHWFLIRERKHEQALSFIEMPAWLVPDDATDRSDWWHGTADEARQYAHSLGLTPRISRHLKERSSVPADEPEDFRKRRELKEEQRERARQYRIARREAEPKRLTLPQKTRGLA
jgi:hypothetical protein